MQVVADIMTKDVITLEPDASLADAHNITRDKGIRHLPVVEPGSGKLRCIVTQKALLTKVINLLTLYGLDKLTEQEQRTSVMEVAEQEFETVQEQTSLLSAARFFVENKHGCLPVVDEQGVLVGIISSSDFVKLSISLMRG